MNTPGDELPTPAHLQPTTVALDMVPARNWWPITPGYRDLIGDDTPATRDEVGELRAELGDVKRAVLRVARELTRKGGRA